MSDTSALPERALPDRAIIVKQHLLAAGVDTQIRVLPDSARTAAEAATGQAIGGVAPIGHPGPLRTFIDEALREHAEIWAAAGHPHTVMPLTFDQLCKITGGEIITVAR